MLGAQEMLLCSRAGPASVEGTGVRSKSATRIIAAGLKKKPGKTGVPTLSLEAASGRASPVRGGKEGRTRADVGGEGRAPLLRLSPVSPTPGHGETRVLWGSGRVAQPELCVAGRGAGRAGALRGGARGLGGCQGEPWAGGAGLGDGCGQRAEGWAASTKDGEAPGPGRGGGSALTWDAAEAPQPVVIC